ncbi:hypothetical protein L1987_83137 [Smallanthus sonchifolius]|uniref:Uncharacterized protein n=1 Tax=Smallanthus sonchifolius TaxID=185202 RepID=A0ACB8YD31_9ASTR|nr:hypothetical protein L1987_83137 [Smallanthus sonchifolius]
MKIKEARSGLILKIDDDDLLICNIKFEGNHLATASFLDHEGNHLAAARPDQPPPPSSTMNATTPPSFPDRSFEGEENQSHVSQIPQERVRLSCLRVLHELAASTTCAEAMVATSVGTTQVQANVFV